MLSRRPPSTSSSTWILLSALRYMTSYFRCCKGHFTRCYSIPSSSGWRRKRRSVAGGYDERQLSLPGYGLPTRTQVITRRSVHAATRARPKWTTARTNLNFRSSRIKKKYNSTRRRQNKLTTELIVLLWFLWPYSVCAPNSLFLDFFVVFFSLICTVD